MQYLHVLINTLAIKVLTTHQKIYNFDSIFLSTPCSLTAQTQRVWCFGLITIVLQSPTSSEFTLALSHEKWAYNSDVTYTRETT